MSDMSGAANRAVDVAAVATTVSAPAWVPALEQVNVVLTTLSLVLGILFLIWRWRKGKL